MRLSTVDIMLTRRCNLCCSFCYIRSKSTDVPANEVERNIATCNWIVKQYKETMAEVPKEHRRIQLNLYGGEPTVAWDSVKAIHEWRKTVTDVPVNMGLVTNMVLMDEAKIDWCIANRVGIHPSIDGCKEVEDTYRITEAGKTVSDQVFRNARILTAKIKGRSCRSTLDPKTVPYMFKSVQFITEDLGFETVNQILAGGVKWEDSDLEVVKQQTTQITDWWINKMRDGKHYSIYYIRNMLGGIWNPMRKRGLCSSGISHAAIDTDGRILPCHRFCNEDTPVEYVMGNIHEGGVVNKKLEDTLRSFDLAKYHKDRCSTCIAVNSCMALCLHEMMLNGSMFEPLPHYCKIWPFYYTEAMRAHAILDAEKNQLYYQTYRPRPVQPQPQPQRPQQPNPAPQAAPRRVLLPPGW